MNNEKLVEELIKNEQYDLADVIAVMTPIDAANYIAANKAYFTKMYNSDDLEQMPLFRKALYDELKTGNVDYNKEFGKDWYKDFENIPLDQIKFVAEKQGKDPNELLVEMRDKATAERRKDIAHEGALGTAMEFFGKRSQEAIERGESPSPIDIGLDVGQTVLEAMPYGQAAKAINNPLVKTALGGVISNTAAPLLTEIADAAVYNNDDRGKFNKYDVLSGTAANAMGANLIRMAGAGLRKFGGDRISNVLMNLGNRESREDAIKAINKMKADIAKKEEIAQKVAKYDGELGQRVVGTDTKYPAALRQEALEYMDNLEDYNKRAAILNKLSKYYPTSKEAKLIKEIDKDILGNDKLVFTDEQLRYFAEDPVMSKYLKELADLPSDKRLAAEEAIKNFITNKIGNYQAEQGKVWTRIPLGLGRSIQARFDEIEKERAIKEEEERILNDLRMRGMLHLSR